MNLVHELALVHG
jgi:hypothetical protein